MSDPRPATPLLDRIGGPADLKRLTPAELRQVADELRAETEARIAQSTIQGRALVEAFLRQAST